MVGRRLPETGAGTVCRFLQVAGESAESARLRGLHHDVGAHARRGLPDPGSLHAAREPAGIAFVLLFYVATPPFVGYFYSIPTEGSYLIVNKNLVELGALLVIFVTRSGLFAGLDRILHGLFARRPRLAEV